MAKILYKKILSIVAAMVITFSLMPLLPGVTTPASAGTGVDTLEELQKALKAGNSNIKITSDIDINSSVTLNLGSSDVELGGHLLSIVDDGNVTIKAEPPNHLQKTGSINAPLHQAEGDSTGYINLYAGAKMTIESGTFNTNILNTGGTLIVNGGTFKSEEFDCTNCKTMIINGGSFICTGDHSPLVIDKRQHQNNTRISGGTFKTESQSPYYGGIDIKYAGPLEEPNTDNILKEILDSDCIPFYSRHQAYADEIGYEHHVFGSEVIISKTNRITKVNSHYTKTGNVTRSQSFKLSPQTISGGGNITYSSSSPYVKVQASGKVTISKNYTGKPKISIYASPYQTYSSAQKDVILLVKPGKMKPSVSNNKKRTLTIRWKKMAGADKYQVAYKRKGSSKYIYKTFQSSVNSCKIKNCKKGKYYFIKLRAYDSQTKSWGAWNTAKKIKILK